MIRKFLMMLLVVAGSGIARGQSAEIVKFDRLEAAITSKKPEVHVINFWATWCGPCVKELPFFQSLEEKHDPSIKITLVSLDFADKISNVNAFISKRNLTPQVILLDEPDYNSWIDRVDNRWSGAIPATLIVNSVTGERKFVEKPLKEGELEQLISEVNK